jgi:hypothetical protein
VRLFSRNKELAVQSFLVKIVNGNCPRVMALREGPRLEGRVNLTMVLLVVPVENEELRLDRAFTAVSKEFSTTGVALVLDEPLELDEVMLGFRWENEMTWVRGKTRHMEPMGGGFFQFGLRLTEMVAVGDYPQLRALVL